MTNQTLTLAAAETALRSLIPTGAQDYDLIRLDAALDALRGVAVEAWQPIETAPKDGTEVLLVVKRRAGTPEGRLVGHWMPGGHCIDDHPPIQEGWYFWDGKMFDRAADPTHWMPLP